MKNGIVEDGWERLWRGQKELSLKAIEKKYAKELAAANPAQRAQIFQRMRDEFDRQKNHQPSAATLL